MALSRTQRSLISSFVFGSVFGLAVIWVANEFVWNNSSPTIRFREASTPDLSKVELSGGASASYAGAVEMAAPSVVNIFTSKTVEQRDMGLLDDPFFRRFFGDEFAPGPRSQPETSLGSGVIISEEGYILTNNHVIEEADEIQIALRDGRNAQAIVVGSDPESDLAVLKADLNLPPVITLGESDKLRVGDVVLAIGNPFGVGQTVTMGIISATGRDRLGINTFENFIQTDAAINPGNSGGALINVLGQLVGINTAIFTRSGGSQGIGFAIPVSIVREVTQQIIKHGHVVRGWLGIEIQDITPALAESFGLEDTTGVIVAGVLRNGPGHKAGLKPGDIILRVEDTMVQDSRHAVNTIAQAAPGTGITLHIRREGKASSLKATTGERPMPSEEERQQ